jgi:hypothetical protein
MIDLLEDVEEYDYFGQFPNYSSLIDIDDVRRFYDDVYYNAGRDKIIRSISDFADRNCGMEKVIEYLKS